MARHRVLQLTLLLVGLVCLFTPRAFAREVPSEDRYRISVVTMGPGDELFTRFGHIGLLVEDLRSSRDVVYNYGTFSFDDPGLWINYARGFLNYWVATNSWIGTQRYYRRVDRFLDKRELRLTPEQEQEMVRKLELNALPENRYYAYRHYLDNCCTRIRDVLDEVTNGAVSAGHRQQVTERTFRDWTRMALGGSPLMRSLILFSLGPAIDHPITRYDEQFLPEVLAEDLDAVKDSNGEPLVARHTRLSARKGTDPRQTLVVAELIVLLAAAALFLLGFVPGIIWPGRVWAGRAAGFGFSLYGLIVGLLGLVLVVFWGLTEHTDTHWNENLLVTPIVHLWLLVPGFRLLRRGSLPSRSWRTVHIYLVAALGLLGFDLLMKLGPFIQGNYEFIALAAVLGALGLAVTIRAERAQAADLG